MPELIKALILTIVIEGAVMLLLTRSGKWLLYNFLCNIITNPLLNICLLLLYYKTGSLIAYHIGIVIGEALVWTTEAAIYRLLSGEKMKLCIIRSVVTNALSLALGLLI